MADYKTNPVEFNAWKHAIHRCYNERDGSYYNYGNRGVTVSTEWLADFNNFLNDMGPRPDNTSLDRIDVNGNYEASNCRWADSLTQAQNKRKQQRRATKVYRTYTKDGVTQSAKQWSIQLGIPTSTINDRKKRGWSDERCLTPGKQAFGKSNKKTNVFFLKNIQAAAKAELAKQEKN